MKSLVNGCRLVCIAAVFVALIAAAPAAADWTSPQEISNGGTRNVSNLQVDANPAGDAVAAWNYALPGVAVVVFPDGSALSPQTYPGSYGAPTVGIGGSSVGALAFGLASSNAIYGASKPGNSNSFGVAATAIHGPGTETATGNPILAVNHLGTAQLFHDSGTPGCDSCTHTMVGRVLDDPETNSWTAGSSFSSTASETHNRVVGTAADGSMVILFKTNNGSGSRAIVPAVIEDNGTASHGGAIDTSSGNGSGALSNPSGISVARMPDASVVAAMERKAGTDGGIFVSDFSKARAAGTGGVAPTETRVSPDEDGSDPHVVTDTAGNAIVSWYDPSDGGADPDAIRARFRAAGSGTWGPTETIATGNLGAHDLAVDALGNAFLVYLDDGADAIKARIRKPGSAGSWGAAETLSTGLSGVDHPHVAAGGGYEAFMAFTADNGVGASARAVYSATGDATPKACEDGVDNDSDGKTDHPADPGCSSPADDDESDPPADTGGDGNGGGGDGGGGGPSGGSMSDDEPGAGPELAKTVNTTPIKGKVRIRIPGTKRFRVLRAGEHIPVGSLVDTTRGRVRLTTATPGGGTQSAVFYQGLFKVTQRARGGLTELRLLGPRPSGCTRRSRRAFRRARSHTSARRNARRRGSRRGKRGQRARRPARLWGSGKGRFRTVGRHGAATVRGTVWLTTERCNGTLFQVKRGTVAVRDFSRKRTVAVRAGRRYLARR